LSNHGDATDACFTDSLNILWNVIGLCLIDSECGTVFLYLAHFYLFSQQFYIYLIRYYQVLVSPHYNSQSFHKHLYNANSAQMTDKL
jgi:hypothetical protein